MAPRKKPRRPAKKAAAKKTNSKISEAQKAAVERRLERNSPRGQAATPGQKNLQRDPNKPTVTAGAAQFGNDMGNNPGGIIGDPVKRGELMARQGRSDGNKGESNQSLSEAANKIVGLSAPVMKQMQAKYAEQQRNNPLAQTNIYGVSNKDRAAKLASLKQAYNDQAYAKLKEQGQAVWMGPQKARIRNRGPQRFDPETGKDTTEEIGGDQILTKSELMSWLADEEKVNQIMAVAQKAGLAVKDYEDASKLWASVVDMAASSYSLAGKQVTPWALIQLRGKYAVNGRMADKVTTTTNIDEMDPAQARLMFEQTAMQALGRSPTKAEVDDFIAKAQTIAVQNPTVTKTTQRLGFDGEVESTVNRTTGGGAQAKAQLAAMDQAKQSEDYAAYQAAGNYFPMLFEALQSPV